MVLVSYSFDEWSSVWADGYLSSPATLRSLAEAGYVEPRELERMKREGLFELDDMFLGMLTRNRPKFLGDSREIDLFYLNLRDDRVVTSYPVISDELQRDNRREHYRGVVVVRCGRDSAVESEKIVGEILSKLQFTIKKEAKYHKYLEFKQDVISLLEDVTSPFYAPCVVARDMLKGNGFEVELI